MKMSANDIVPVAARRAKRKAARSRALRRTDAACVAGVATRDARERRQALAEISAMMRRSPFLDAEL